jgi:hypothetical protein
MTKPVDKCGSSGNLLCRKIADDEGQISSHFLETLEYKMPRLPVVLRFKLLRKFRFDFNGLTSTMARRLVSILSALANRCVHSGSGAVKRPNDVAPMACLACL